MRIIRNGQPRHMQPCGAVQNFRLILHIRTAAGNKKNFIQRKHGVGIFCQEQMPHMHGIEGSSHNAHSSVPFFSF